jgi:hypothetical protein
MKTIVVLFCALALSACSIWHPPEQRAFAFAATCHAVDLVQTDWALEHGYREMNPLLGDHPSDNRLIAHKAAVMVATWGIAEQFSGEDRWKAILVTTIPCIIAVGHNYSEGARP